ncbi:MAG TPA: hypothetical protein VMZ22_03885 [Acidimicrobiales bacterium]|nr:hypothetical protein [Acidimicrobiales bacterium]
MNAVVKLTLFAVLLVVMVAGGAALGAATQPDRNPAPSHEHSAR